MAKIIINGVAFDPERESDQFALAGLEKADSAHSDYILVQTTGPLPAAQRDQLRAASAMPLEYVSADTYLCHFTPASLDAVKALPFVRWAHAYPEQFKIAPSLRTPDGMTRPEVALTAMEGVTTSMSQQPRSVEVVFHRDVDAESVRKKVAAAARLDPKGIRIEQGKMRVTVQPQALERIAAIDEVRHIEEYLEPKLHNSIALRLIGADRVHSQVKLEGKGQVVAVCDTGFDLGSTTDVHPAFKKRVLHIYPLGRPGSGSDPHGHGTHVAGSVLGDGQSAAMGEPVRGAAPRAQLVLQSVMDANGKLGGLPEDLRALFAAPYDDHGARIHSNSWGAPTRSAYTQQSYAVDDFVWSHRDMVVLFSAGNEGVDDDGNGITDKRSIESPGTAKNCITIGASESERPAISRTYGSAWPEDFRTEPIAGDLWADNPNGMAAFSSRGPTLDGRIKPDLVAPGTAILSARSRAIPNPASGNSFWGTSGDALYSFMGGTSMATPIAAGCAALVREFLQQGGNLQPSAALVKAMLINGAADLPGQYRPPDAGAIPNYSEGFGRIHMPATVGPQASGVVLDTFDEDAALDTGEEWTHQVQLSRAGRTAKLTLVWTDPAGETLQNDLDLIARTSRGEERHGNAAAAVAAFDRNNNVEQIIWTGLPAGTLDIVVRAYRAALVPQTFALVVRIV